MISTKKIIVKHVRVVIKNSGKIKIEKKTDSTKYCHMIGGNIYVIVITIVME